MKLFKGKKVIYEQPELKPKTKVKAKEFGDKAFEEISKLLQSTNSMIFLSDTSSEKEFYRSVLADLKEIEMKLIEVQKKIKKSEKEVFNECRCRS